MVFTSTFSNSQDLHSSLKLVHKLYHGVSKWLRSMNTFVVFSSTFLSFGYLQYFLEFVHGLEHGPSKWSRFVKLSVFLTSTLPNVGLQNLATTLHISRSLSQSVKWTTNYQDGRYFYCFSCFIQYHLNSSYIINKHINHSTYTWF